MNRLRRIGLIICIVSLVISAIGCDMVKVDPEKDRKRVVAKVDGDEILKGEFLDLYGQYKGMYGITEEMENDSEYKESIDQTKNMILDQLVMEKIIYNKAIEAGFEVDDKAKTEAKEQLMSELEENYKLDENNDSEDAEKLAKEQLDEYIDSLGMTEDEFWEMAAKQEQIDKFIEQELQEVEATDADIKKYYEEQLKEQKENPEMAESAPVILYMPEGYIRVKHILIELSEADRQEHMSLVSAGKQEEADKLLEEKLEDIEPKAKEVLEKAKDGENFEGLIEEYSSDGMDVEEGYTLNEDTNFIEPFKDAAFNLKNEGDISDLVGSEFGYHIIKLYDILPEKDYTLEEREDQIREVVEYEKKNQKWASRMEEWEEQADIKRYEKRL